MERSRQISLMHVVFLKTGHLMKLFTTTEFECNVRGIITEDRFPRQQIVLVNSISIQEVQCFEMNYTINGCQCNFENLNFIFLFLAQFLRDAFPKKRIKDIVLIKPDTPPHPPS